MTTTLEADLVDAFRKGLRQLGYVEGQNLVITYQWAKEQQERHAVLAQELVRLRPDVILTAGTPGTLAAKHDYTDMYHRATTYVAKILRGATPADLPMEQPTKFEFVINLKIAQALGLTIPPMVLFQADEVIR